MCRVIVWRPVMVVTLVFVFAAVSGCRHSAYSTSCPAYQQDAAMVTVSVMPPIPFAEVASELSPKIGLTFEQALKDAVQTSTGSSTLLRDMFAAAFSAGITDGKSGIPGIGDKAVIPGTGEGAMPDVGSGSGVPAIIKYSSAVALYQEVKLLETYVKHALNREGYSAYVLRVPISVFPVRRDLSLDVYTTLSFFVNRKSGVRQNVPMGEVMSVLPPILKPDRMEVTLPQVLPLIVTEHLEAEQYDGQTQKLREYGMSLLLMFENLGIGGGFKNAREEFERIVGNDYNTLMSLGRLSENSIVARLGATRNPAVKDGGYEMLPRTHTASFLLLVKKEEIDSSTTIDMLAKTDLHKTGDGTVVSSKNTIQLLRGIKPLIRSYYRDSEQYEVIPDRFLLKKQAVIERLVNTVVSNDALAFRVQFEDLLEPVAKEDGSMESFKDSFKDSTRNGSFPESDFGLLWQQTLNMVRDLKTNKVSFDLPVPKQVVMPDPDTTNALMCVNEKQLSVKLFGCRYLTGKNLAVTLRLGDGNGKHLLLGADKVSVFGDGTGLSATFLSPKELGMKLAEIKKSILNVVVNNDKTWQYGHTPATPAEKKKKKGVTLSIPGQIALAQGSTVGELRISVSGAAKAKDTLVVRVDGGNDAELRSIVGNGTVLGNQDKDGWRTLTGDGSVILPVSGLRNGQRIELLLGVKKKGKVSTTNKYSCTAISG